MVPDLPRSVRSPDGTGYEVKGAAKEWRLGTSSLLLDALAFVWAVIRQARGKEWVVSVRQVDSKEGPLIERFVKTEEEAAATVAELAESIESGQLTPLPD